MYDLTNKLRKVEPYEPVSGEYKIRLDANESYFKLTDYFGEKIAKAVTEIDYNRYPDPVAQKAVDAFAKLYDVPAEFVTAGNGSDELISIICSCFLQKNDKVLTLSPDFSMYAFYSYLYELQTVTLHKDENLNIDVSKVINYCNNNDIKALIFSNPCNPTSLGLSKEDVIRLVKNVFCLVIIDEAYMEFWDQSILSEVKNYDNIIILKTCSKAIGLAAVRLGFAVAQTKITNALRAVKSPYNINSVSQKIGEIVLSDKPLLDKMTKEIIENKNILQAELERLAFEYDKFEYVYKSATNFVFIKTSYADEIFVNLQKKSVSVRKMNGYLRICTGSAKENSEFISILEGILKELN